MTMLKIAMITALLMIGCSDDSGKSGPSENNANNTNNTNNTNGSTTGEGGERPSFATYNVGLAVGFVPLAEERKDAVVSAVSEIDADVICLQEVWLNQVEDEWRQDNIDAIIAATQATHPHAYYQIGEVESAVGCTEEEVAPLETCVLDACDGVPDGELAGCVLESCGTEFGAVSSDCSSCLVGQLGNPFEDIKAACVGSTQSAYYSNGHNGLLLLSKTPLEDQFYEEMEAVQVARSILAATTTLPSGDEVRVYCNHLTAEITGVEYPGDEFDSYEAEQKVQVERLIELVGEETLPTVVLGDFNAGPADEGLDAELPANYELYVNAGWTNVFLDVYTGPACSYCSSNTLVDSTTDKAIDHIFVVNAEPIAARGDLLFTETVDVEGAQSHISDHFGVRVIFDF
jgi:endonuclease/exonuclease/phosphatase family metal-dependent hydrolase